MSVPGRVPVVSRVKGLGVPGKRRKSKDLLDMSTKETAILLRDIQGEKTSVLEKIGLKGSSPRTVHRGELLLGAKEPGSDLRYQLTSNPAVIIHCCANDVAPLSQYEFDLLVAVKSPSARYQILQNDLLDWAVELRNESNVLVALPSHRAIPDQCALATVKYIGPLPKEYGMLFGVEIIDPASRGYGATNGAFGDNQFFVCDENCGLFVALDRLWLPPDHQSRLPPQDWAHPMVTHSRDQQNQGSPEQRQKYSPTPSGHSQGFSIGSRVVFFNKKGIAVHGTMRWTGMVSLEGGVQPCIGIETDVSVSSKEVAGAVPGLGQLFRCTHSRHGRVVIPESMAVSEADAARAQAKQEAQQVAGAESSVDVHIPSASKEEELAKKSRMRFKIDDQVIIFDKHNTPLYGRVRWIGRKTLLGRDLGELHVGIETGVYVYPNEIPKAKTGLSGLFNAKKNHSIVLPESMVVSAEAYVSKRERSSKDRKGQREAGDPPPYPQDPVGLAREFIIEQKRAMKEHEEQKRKRDQQKAKCEVKQALSESVTFAERQQSLDGIRGKHGKQESPRLKQSFLDVGHQQSSDNAADQHRSGTEGEGVGEPVHYPLLSDSPRPSHDSKYQQYYQPNVDAQSQYQEGPSDQPDTPHHHLTEAARNSTLSSTGSSSALHLAVGSRVQMPTQSPIEPFRYGVIRWIGKIPPMQGLVAGIEMEEAMEGCGDGIWDGARYFSCRPGYGFFYPLSSLALDERYKVPTNNRHGEVQNPNMQQIENLNQQIKELKAAIEHQQKESNTKIAKLQQDLRSERETLSRFQQLSTELQQQLTETKAENSSLLASQKESVAFGIEPWKVHRNKVELGNVLGGGGWGVVYKGKLQVAVKQFYPNIMSKQNLALLKREMRMLALIRHPNLLQFIAAVFDENEDYEQKPPYIITELLDTTLRSAYENAQLPSHSLPSIFIDTARALDYLHRRHEPIIHRDVSSANVLLRQQENGKWIAKLSDLGSANLAKEAYTMNAGARPYCAPEAFTFHTNARSAGTLTPKIDVYSYGIMLCEVATSTFPEEGKCPSMLARVQCEWPQLHQLIIACTNQSPEQRPTMANVLASLEAFPPRH